MTRRPSADVVETPHVTEPVKPGTVKPLRVATYARVSSDEQVQGFSLDAQKRALRTFCTQQGWIIVEEYCDPGRSARHDDLRKRPDFRRMLRDAELHRFDTIIVHKLDRFARNMTVLLNSLERLGQAGVTFRSVTEQNIDYTTAMGRMFLGMIGTLAQWYSDNLSTETKKGKAERTAQGFHNGLLPFGTMAGPSGRPVPDVNGFSVLNWVVKDGRRIVDGGRETNNVAGLQLAVKCALDGMSDSQVAEALNAAGYRTSGNRGNNPFTKDSIRVILTNRFYWGLLPAYEEETGDDGKVRRIQVGWTRGAHEPLPGFDEDTWQRLAAVRAANCRRASRTGVTAQTYTLTGLGVCGKCGGALGVHRDKHGIPRVYCRSRSKRGSNCDNQLTFQGVYEDQIAKLLDSVRVPEEFHGMLVALLDAGSRGESDDTQSRRSLEGRLDRLQRLYVLGDISEDDFLRQKMAIQRKLEAQASSPTTPIADAFMTTLTDIRTAWDVADQAERHLLASALIQSAVIRNDRIVDLRVHPAFRSLLQPTPASA